MFVAGNPSVMVGSVVTMIVNLLVFSFWLRTKKKTQKYRTKKSQDITEKVLLLEEGLPYFNDQIVHHKNRKKLLLKVIAWLF